MRKIQLLSMLALFAFVCCLGAQAQSAGNVFGGYTFLRQGSGAPHLNGWNAQLEGRVIPHLSAVVEASGNLGSENASSSFVGLLNKIDYSRVNFYAGPRVSMRIGRFRPFAHVMLGISHLDTKFRYNIGSSLESKGTDFSTLTGGGVDTRILPHVDWRNQIDLVSTKNGDMKNEFRYTTGIAVRF